MNTILYICRILYKKRWWLIILPTIAAIALYAILSSQPKKYKSTTTIYTGIVSGYDAINISGTQDWMAVNNSLENLLSIVKAESTLENVFLKLFSRNILHIDVEHDNEYQTVESSRELVLETPEYIFDYVVDGDEQATYENMKALYLSDMTNYLQQLFHWEHHTYSYKVLSKVQVERVGGSDMISISYENDDKYIVYNTLKLLVDEFIEQYIYLRYEQTNDVVAYYEAELARIQRELTAKENTLTDYNIRNQIINYEEQTKQVAERSKGIDENIEEVTRNLNGAIDRLAVLEEKLGGASDLYLRNAEFVSKLHDISSLYTESSKAETFEEKAMLSTKIDDETDQLKHLSSIITAKKFSNEGLAVDNIAVEWLNDILLEAKSRAELEVLLQSRKDLYKEFERFSPVGSSLKRQNRDITFSEQNYLSNLEALNEARIRQKNLQLTSATFKILSPPTVAITAEKSKNLLFTIICFVLVLTMLIALEIIKELLNKRPYDKFAADKLISAPIIGAFPMITGNEFDEVCAEFAANQIGNAVVNFFDRTKQNNIINILSMDGSEGKTLIANALMEYFRKLDAKPVFVSWNKDFDAESKYYLLAGSIYDFAINEENVETLPEADVTIVEYPPLYNTSFPTKLLAGAAVNILIVDAERRWKGMDQILLRQLKENDKEDNIVVCLNGADKDAVGTFTGMLPPYTTSHRIRYTMWNLGSNPTDNK